MEKTPRDKRREEAREDDKRREDAREDDNRREDAREDDNRREDAHEDQVEGRPRAKEKDDYQATVALSGKDLAAAGVGGKPKAGTQDDYQSTVALSREELAAARSGGKAAPEAEDGYQSTVALSREELAAARSGGKAAPEAEDGYQFTVALSREELAGGASDAGSAGEADGGYQATVALRRNGTAPAAPPARGPAPDPDDFSVTPMERDYYNRLVRKGDRDDKYQFVEKLVEGGMGAILRVMDQGLQRVSAMKVIRPRHKSVADSLTSFVAEAKITGLLEHPNIIPVHELGLTPEQGMYFTMKLVHGEALNDILERLRDGGEYAERYNPYHLLNIFRKVCDAVSFAHSRHIIHQDIKPHNIIVGPYGEVLLMDWGLARYIGDPEAEPDPARRDLIRDFTGILKSDDDMIKGSPAYMSPEQVAGGPGDLDERSDIFLLGATLYHIFTLESPYAGADIHEIFAKARDVDLIPPDQRAPDRQIPEEIRRIILKAMAPDKANRYQRVSDMSADIDDLLAGRWSRQERKTFAAGELLMRQGETGDEAYLILRGRVEVIRETEEQTIVLGALSPGDIVGEMSLIARMTRSAGVKALEETEVAVLTQHIVSENLKKLPPYMEKIVSALTDRLRMANENIHPWAAADCGPVVAKQLGLLLRDRAARTGGAPEAPLDEMAREIAHDLGLSGARVREAVMAAAAGGEFVVEGDQVRSVRMAGG